MAGKARDDKTPRTTHTIQVCLADEDVKRLRAVANKHHEGKVSVAARHLLRLSLAG